MTWTDQAVLLSVAKTGQNTLRLSFLAEENGRQTAMLHVGKSAPMLLPGCWMEVTVAAAPDGGPGEVRLGEIEGGLIVESADSPSLLVVAYARALIEEILPPSMPAPEICRETRDMVTELSAEDGRWPIHFARWEMAVLSALGHVTGFARCRSAFNHGDTIYLSPKSGKIVTRTECGAFLDRMMPVPGFLMGASNATPVEVGQALELTGTLFRRFVCPELGMEDLPKGREKILTAFRRLRAIPKASVGPRELLSAEDHRQRALAMRPLMVGRGGASRA